MRIGKVDATEQTKLAGKYEVKGYPTLMWFVNGVQSEFTGGRTADEIVSWIVKRSGPPSTKVETKEAIEEKKASDKLVVSFHVLIFIASFHWSRRFRSIQGP
jgi:protein disulfide-isomerase A1